MEWTRTSNRAVVLGGSIAGLLAARALAEHYERVTVVERDRVAGGDGHRRGAPQSRQVHVLLPRGLQALEVLLPGLTDELVHRGATRGGSVDAVFCFSGRRLCPVDAGVVDVRASRLLIEHQIRSRVLALPNVDLLDGWQAAELVSHDATVTGVGLRRAAPPGGARVLDADLVVDATGRGSRAPGWLEAMGVGRPDEDEVLAHVVYTTIEFPQRRDEPIREIIVGPEPPAVRGGAAVAVEGGRWVVTLAGRGDDRAPTDTAGFVAWAETLPVPDIHALVHDREPLTEAVVFQYRANRRRRYDRMARLPAGLVVVGDALCSFNPVYGQGMSMAAIEALTLRDCLAEGASNLGPRFFKAVAPHLQVAWDMATMTDARYPGAGVTRTLKDRLVGGYLDRVLRTAGSDPVVAAAFLRVATLVEPPESVLHPRIARRVFTGPVRPVPGGHGAPAPTTT